MTTNVTFRSGDRSPPADPRSIPCLILPTLSGVVGTSYTLDPGDDVVGTIGAGKAAFWTLLAHAGAGTRVEVCAATPTWTALAAAAMTESVSGPNITITDVADGALDDFPGFRIKIKTSGALTTPVTADVSYDGTSYVETIQLPQEGPAVVRGTVDISSAVPAMNGLTIVTTAPTSDTMTFATSPTTPEALVATYDALADAQGSTTHGRIYEAADGKKYFEIVTDDVGSGVSLTIDAGSTGEGTLGLSTTTATGTAATMTLPNTGVTITCAAGTYAGDTVYSYALVGPTMSIAAQVAAATAALANFDEHPFGYLVFPEQASHIAAATLAGSINTLVAAAAADPDNPKFVDFVIGTAFHTASATKATNDTNIGTSDAAFSSAISGLSASMYRNFAHDDFYAAAPAGLPAGTFRRSAALAATIRRSSLDRLAGNPGQYAVPLVGLLAADGLTRARDEASATTKLGTKNGKAWCLKSIANNLGNVKFEVSPTGAGASSRFWDPGTVAVALSLAATTVATTRVWEGESWETDPEDPSAALPELLEARAAELKGDLDPIAKPKNKPANISGELSVVVTAPEVLDDGKVYPSVTFNPLAVPGIINITITATGAVISEGA
jgi:hypothetical protein